MKFRYNYTGNENPILKLPYLEYETLFYSEKDNIWKKTKSIIKDMKFVFEEAKTDKKRKLIQKKDYT